MLRYGCTTLEENYFGATPKQGKRASDILQKKSRKLFPRFFYRKVFLLSILHQDISLILSYYSCIILQHLPKKSKRLEKLQHFFNLQLHYTISFFETGNFVTPCFQNSILIAISPQKSRKRFPAFLFMSAGDDIALSKDASRRAERCKTRCFCT